MLSGAAAEMEKAGVASDEATAAHSAAPGRARKLARVLLFKAACDLFFVLALACVFFFGAFAPWLSGRVEVSDGYVAGYIAKRGHAAATFNVQLFVNDKFIAHTLVHCAASSEAGSSAAKRGCDFRFRLPELGAGEHEVRVYASRVEEGAPGRALYLLGETQRFVNEK